MTECNFHYFLVIDMFKNAETGWFLYIHISHEVRLGAFTDNV